MSGGGVGSVITDVSEAMAKEGAEVYVVSLFQRKNIDFQDSIEWGKKNNINVTVLQENNEGILIIFRKLNRYIKKLASQDKCCLFLHLKWGVLAGIISTIGLENVHRIEVYHSGYMKYKLQSFICRPFIEKYIAVSKDAKKQLHKWFHIKENLIEVVYNGVDFSNIKNKCGTKCGGFQNSILFTSIGRLSFEKGFNYAIEAFAKMKSTNPEIQVSYTMVGDGKDRCECESLAKGFVNFTGTVEREVVYEYITNSDVMILPSLWEGNSILLLEVIAVGKPMILTDIPSFREVFRFKPLKHDEIFRVEQFGCVIRPQDVNSCLMAMKSIILRKNEFNEIEEYVHSFAPNFSLQTQAEKYLNIIDGF